MSLRGGTRAKKERRPYTRLEKGLLAFAAACLVAAAVMFLNYGYGSATTRTKRPR